MKVENVNSMFRNLFEELLCNENIKKKHICSLLLGSQCEPQFDGFMKGNNFGIKPLQKIAESLGYDVQLIFTQKNDEELSKHIMDVNHNFIKDTETKLMKHLSNEDFLNTGVIIESGAIQTVVDDIMKIIINN